MINTVLITTSGTGERLGSLTKHTNKSLVKVGDKYGICWIIDLYPKNFNFIITIGYYGNLVKDFLLLAYPEINFTFIQIDKYVGNGSSLGYSLLQAKDLLNKPFIFHCCDCIITDKIDFNFNTNTLFVCASDTNLQYTSVKGLNNLITEINGKNHYEFDFVYIGIAIILNYMEFWNNLNYLYLTNPNNQSLNDVDSFKLMLNDKINFEYKIINNWYDTGNIQSYELIKKIFKSKYCVLEKNYESICFLNNKVVKFINDKDINKKRYLRGVSLGNNIPKIYSYSSNFISMELINGSVLSDLYDYNIISKLLEWAKNNLWINQKYDEIFSKNCYNFYINKTFDRLNKVTFISNELDTINCLKCKSIFELIKSIPYEKIMTNTLCQFHGDFILDNILLTSDNNFKLIDWRHEFDTLLDYGDMYYDLAKLRHNIIFNHKNIDNELYQINIINNYVELDLKCNYLLIKQLEDFDNFVIINNLDLNKIKLLTAIIWLNMSPLYDGKLSLFLFYFGKYNLQLLLN